MVRKTFNAKLRSVKNLFNWSVSCGELRAFAKSKKKALKGIDFCPLTALHYALNGEILDPSDYDTAAKRLGVSKSDADVIVHLADNHVDFLEGNQVLSRQWLLKNVGLKPEVRNPNPKEDLW